MNSHPLRQIIEACDRAISARDFDALMAYYAPDAALVVRPDLVVTGQAAIRKAFTAISDYFQDQLVVEQGELQVIEGADNALVIMETVLHYPDDAGGTVTATRRATYVFQRQSDGRWLCAIDNSYGTALLDG
ncbi:YybH family protein [Entomohabitans teleogrylli]|uniref:YybH family protein n=1 Tax=Entomohabitans teleogrylli TaxID=1384589 RepID=UPI00073D90ED|nr:SgcJ/EcaC family oxidoreductase [Entomohabitans teleogrylli]